MPAILGVHNRYQQAGGEDVVFEAEMALLESVGHRVGRFVVDNSTIPDSLGMVDRVRLAARTIWSRQSAVHIRQAIRAFRPDVVHVHNTFPLLSPAIYEACASERVPVVQTLHNYRLVCPTATLFRDGHPCEDCVGHRLRLPGVLHACYQDSRVKSAVVAGMLAFHDARGTWDRVTTYIALSEFSRSVFVRGGLSADRIVVKPNFIEPDPGGRRADGDAFVFVGRLAPEKGLDTLLRAWSLVPQDVRIVIVGDGPMAAGVEEAAAMHGNIEMLGRRDRQEVLSIMAASRAVIVPSVWYEGAPLTVLEAFGCGAPVIASRLGSLEEAIDHGRTGLHFAPGRADELAGAVTWMTKHADEARAMGNAARAEYLSRYTGKRNYADLLSIYKGALAAAEFREGREAGPATTRSSDW
jgi:glycosyltransferase involved in cell wall biosynthesis